MGCWAGHVAVLILLNINCLMEGRASQRSPVCPKELNAFTVSNHAENASSDSTRICSAAFACCNESIEREMKTRIIKKLKSLVDDRNERVKTRFKVLRDGLKGFSENILLQISESAVKYLQSRITTVGMAHQVAPYINTLFKDLQSYLTEKDLRIENSTNKFFRNFYPIVHQHFVARSKTPLPPGFSKCLMNKMHLINPFKTIPKEVTLMLEKDLVTVQVFLSGLQIAQQILEVTKNIELSKQCSDSLVKMSYCSLCDGFKDSKPCPGYCSHIISLCLESYTYIDPYWNSFIEEMDDLLTLLEKSLDASAMFSRLQSQIGESMSHATLSDRKVFHHCGNMTSYKFNGNRIVTLKQKQKDAPARDANNGDLYLAGDSQNSFQNLPTASDNSKRLVFVRRNLSETKDNFRKLLSELCKADGLAVSEKELDKCWIGTGLGRYNSSSKVVNATSFKPVNSDSLIKGALLLLQNIKGEIENAKNLIKKTPDDSNLYGSASGSGSGGGSSDVNGNQSNNIPSGSGDCIDDEDCPSGSGSGEKINETNGDGQNITGAAEDVSKTTPKVKGARSGGSKFQFLGLGLLTSLLHCVMLGG